MVLVAAAPCALANAVPVTVVVTTAPPSRLGVPIMGGAGNPSTHAVALDKTGTLTANRACRVDVAIKRRAPRVKRACSRPGSPQRTSLAVAVLPRLATTAASDVSRPGRRADRPSDGRGWCDWGDPVGLMPPSRRSCGVRNKPAPQRFLAERD